MVAGKYNIEIEQGTTFVLPLTFYTDETRSVVEDYTGCSWRMQIRKNVESTDFIIELTSSNDRINILNQDTGRIILELSAAETEDLDFREAVYDLEKVKFGVVTRMLEGVVYLRKEVTR